MQTKIYPWLVLLLVVSVVAFWFSKNDLSGDFDWRKAGRNLKTDILENGLMGESVSFTYSQKDLTVGESFNFEAQINPGSKQVTAVALKVDFPADRIQCQSMTADSSIWNVLIKAAIDNSQGSASITVGVIPDNGGITSLTAIAKLTCTAKTSGSGIVSFNQETKASATGEGSNSIIKTFVPMNFLITTEGNKSSPTSQASVSPTVSATPKTTPTITPTPTFFNLVTPTVYVTVVPTVEYDYTTSVAPASGTATNVALLLSISAMVTLGIWLAIKKIKG